MKPRTLVGSATSPDGTQLELYEHDGDFMILANRVPLMTTRLFLSEQELARLGCEGLRPDARVLVGGLGMGYTLGAALECLSEQAQVVVAELSEAVVEWNRGPLAPFAGHPLDDPRTEVVLGDARRLVERSPGSFDAILLDIDNGPTLTGREQNSWLYTPAGLRALGRALRPGGTLAIWGAADEDPRFPERMSRQGFQASKHKVPARPGKRGGFHMVYLGRSRATG